MHRWIFAILVVAVVVVVAATFFRAFRGRQVEAVVVERGQVRAYVEEQAKSRLPREYLITVPQAGRVEAVALEIGDRVQRGDVVARMVQEDLEIAVAQAKARVARAEAAIEQNKDVSVEQTGLKQTVQFVVSMEATVKAAAARIVAGRARAELERLNLERVEMLAATGAKTVEELQEAQVAKVQADVDLQQDILVHASLLAMQAATNLLPAMVREYIARKALQGDILEQELADAQAALDEVQIRYERGTIRSPVDGVVLAREETNERTLSAGAPLLKIGRLEELEIEAEILTQEAVGIRPGDRVEILGPGAANSTESQVRHRGSVVRVDPAGFTKISSLGVEQQRVRVVIGFDPGVLDSLLKSESIGVEYRLRVYVITDSRENVLRVPRMSVFRGERGEWQVFAVRDGRAELATVEIGLLNDDWVEIAAGLNQGDTIVLAPATDLSSGQRVDPQF